MQLSLLFLLILSYFSFVHNFWQPAALFWDENYHIASAQKYLHGIYFMEPHPPLGKLVIAAGEYLTHANAQSDQFIGTDYATNPPPGFSFFGYRLFPVILAWLTTPLLFGIFFLITRKYLWSILLSFLYIFDNAIIVHTRSAMLESTLLFFTSLTLLSFLLLLESKDNRKLFNRYSLLFGAAFGAAMATKAFALLFILLAPMLLWVIRKNVRLCWSFLWKAALAFGIVYIGIWQIHFARGSTINPSLPDAGYYQASDQYKAILQSHKNTSIFAFPYMLRDSLNFVGHYQAGVPRLDLAKADENGSPWFLWPFGGRTISYRWETPDGSAYKYLYLQSNPVIWFLGLSGVVLSFALLVASVVFSDAVTLKRRYLITVFFTLYVCFLAAVSTIDRVMYLYHYFVPLTFSFVLFALAFDEIERIGSWKLTTDRKSWLLLGLGVLMFASFQFYRPLTYYEPLTTEQFQRRNLLNIWDMHCVNCERNSPFVQQTR